MRRWVYVDCGVFGGLAETLGESIRYRLVNDKAGYRLPSTLEAGDIVRIASTGAYTTSYSAIGFNGFPPLQQVYNESQLLKSKPRSGAVSIG